MPREWSRVLRTVGHLPVEQLARRVEILVARRVYTVLPSLPLRLARRRLQDARSRARLPIVPVEVTVPDGLAAVRARAERFAAGSFDYLGTDRRLGFPPDWYPDDASPLWCYQLQYLGSVLDLALAGRVGDARRLLESWTEACGRHWDRVAWHPYPVSLRLVNVLDAAAAAGGLDRLGPAAVELVGLHGAYLLTHLERDVRGNHLLENLRALAAFARSFEGAAAERADALLRWELPGELARQVLSDGGHFELSPLYHTIVLQRLLELCHRLGLGDSLTQSELLPRIDAMARFLAAVVTPDDDLPLLGDSVRGFGPPPARLLELCEDLTGRSYQTSVGFTPLRASGLAVWRTGRSYAILDLGAVCPPELPAHGQADALTFELWHDGMPFVVDPGVPEYSGPERAWSRASTSHSTVVVDGRDHDEVYGSFRVGGRSRIDVSWDTDAVEARLSPWYGDVEIRRRARLSGAVFELDDAVRCSDGAQVEARVLLHPGVVLEPGDAEGRRWKLAHGAARVQVESTHRLRVEAARVSRGFGLVQDTAALVQTYPATSDGTPRRGAFRFLLETSGR